MLYVEICGFLLKWNLKVSRSQRHLFKDLTEVKLYIFSIKSDPTISDAMFSNGDNCRQIPITCHL